MSGSAILLGGAVSVAAVGTGVATMVRSIVRPNQAKAKCDYGTPEEHGLPAEEIRLAGGIYGWWVVAPQADVAVLLVHGRSRASGWMYPLAQRLWPRSSVLAIDLPGHGKSRDALVTYGFEESEVVREAIAFLEQRQSRPIVVVGISMGGAASIIAQAKYPSSRVVGLATIGTYADIRSVFVGICKSVSLPWAIGGGVLRLAGRIAGFDLKNNRPIECVRSLSVPYLAIQGDMDELVPVESARQLAEACASSSKGFSYYHGPHDVPSDPQVLHLVDDFVQRCAAAAEVQQNLA